MTDKLYSKRLDSCKGMMLGYRIDVLMPSKAVGYINSDMRLI